jgi:hypothetical protein
MHPTCYILLRLDEARLKTTAHLSFCLFAKKVALRPQILL